MVQRETAILLERHPRGAESVVLNFLTRHCGKVSLYYRRFPKRVRLEFLDPLQTGELLFSPATERSPGRLHSFDCEQVWPAIRMDFDRLVCSLHFADLVSSMTREGEPVADVFELLQHFLSHLEAGADTTALRITFTLQLLKASGFAPRMQECVVCHKTLPATDAAFSPMAGGLLCGRCLSERAGPYRELSAGSVSVMRKALTIPRDKASRLKAGAALTREILPLLEEMVETVLERRPQSSLFLGRMKALKDAGQITTGRGK